MKPTAQRRRDRRDLLDNLLSRALRGNLTTAEAALLAESVREEQRVADQTRRSLGETGNAFGKHRAAADDAIRELEQRALDAEEQLTAYRSVLGPRPLDRIRDAEQRAEQAEERARKAERAADLLAGSHGRAEAAEERLARIRDMADAWEQRLPATIRTATAAEAVRNAANGDDRPVMFGMTDAAADDEQPASMYVRVPHWEYDLMREQQQRAERAEAARDRFEAAWTNARHRASVATRLASTRQERLRIRARRIINLEQQAETAERSAKAWEDTARRYATNMDDARHQADRYRLAWLACRRDRRADRATMAAELPAVQAIDRIRDYIDDAYEGDVCEGVRRDVRRLCAGKQPTYNPPVIAVGPPRRAPEVITDRATIRNALDEHLAAVRRTRP
ncbi:hypothetical protein [Streptomyces sp. NPDC091046]|uniref:hypothetical protein n=1 Tax=Streptomyces sp. NPDC091046 TaxID=3365973 RepID=UPI00382FED91